MANGSTTSITILALDVGSKRIGTATANTVSKMPQPGPVIQNDDSVISQLETMIKSSGAAQIVIGIPRNLDGDETAQSRQIRDFAGRLQVSLSLDIIFTDESLSSIRADELLKSGQYNDAGRDSLAACFILEEYLHEL